MADSPAPILFVHYGEDWIRGSERCLLDLIGRLDRTRFRPIAWCNAPAMAEALRALDVPTHQSRFTILLGWEPPRFDLRSYARLVREGAALVDRYGVQLIHVNSGAPNQWMLPVARSKRVPLLAHLHGMYPIRERFTLGLAQASLTVGVSQAVTAGLASDGMRPDRVRVIHSGVDRARLSQGDASSLRQKLGIPEDAIVAVSIGSLIHRKGFDVLLHALAQLAEIADRDAPDLRLIIVGDGPDREALESLRERLQLEMRVHLLGERQDTGAILRDVADILVAPARSEAFGLTPIEAGLFAVPVIATAVDGLEEAVADGESGLLVPSEDPAALAQAMLRLARTPELRRRLGEAGQRRAETQFSVDRYAADFEASYASLLARPAASNGWRGPRTPLRGYLPWLRQALLRRLR